MRLNSLMVLPSHTQQTWLLRTYMILWIVMGIDPGSLGRYWTTVLMETLCLKRISLQSDEREERTRERQLLAGSACKHEGWIRTVVPLKGPKGIQPCASCWIRCCKADYWWTRILLVGALYHQEMRCYYISHQVQIEGHNAQILSWNTNFYWSCQAIRQAK